MAASAAEEKPSAPEASGGASSNSGGGGNKLVLIFTIVNLVATVAIVAILFISFKRDRTAPSVTDIAAQSEGEHGEKKEEGGHGGEGGEAKGEHGGGEHGKSPKKIADYGRMVTLDQFTVNLSTPGSASPKFVRVNISLEAPNAEVEQEVTSKMPQVRNVIIDLFNSKRPADLSSAEGRDYLKEEIKNALNSVLVSGKLKGVFFTNFTLGT